MQVLVVGHHPDVDHAGAHNLVRDVGHELGHALGLAHYVCGQEITPPPYGGGEVLHEPAIMNSETVDAPCTVTATGNRLPRITRVDLADFLNAYYGPPSTPGGLTATPGNERIALRWDEATDTPKIDRYQYRVDDGEWQNISGSSASTTTHALTGLTNGTGYTVEIRAVRGPVSSEPSTAVSATPRPPPPPPTTFPLSFEATATGSTSSAARAAAISAAEAAFNTAVSGYSNVVSTTGPTTTVSVSYITGGTNSHSGSATRTGASSLSEQVALSSARAAASLAASQLVPANGTITSGPTITRLTASHNLVTNVWTATATASISWTTPRPGYYRATATATGSVTYTFQATVPLSFEATATGSTSSAARAAAISAAEAAFNTAVSGYSNVVSTTGPTTTVSVSYITGGTNSHSGSATRTGASSLSEQVALSSARAAASLAASQLVPANGTITSGPTITRLTASHNLVTNVWTATATASISWTTPRPGYYRATATATGSVMFEIPE